MGNYYATFDFDPCISCKSMRTIVSRWQTKRPFNIECHTYICAQFLSVSPISEWYFVCIWLFFLFNSISFSVLCLHPLFPHLVEVESLLFCIDIHIIKLMSILQYAASGYSIQSKMRNIILENVVSLSCKTWSGQAHHQNHNHSFSQF